MSLSGKAIAQTVEIEPNYQERQVTISWLIDNNYPPLPVAPKQDPFKYPKKNKSGEIEYDADGTTPKPLFTGKNPSYLDRNGTPHLVNHRTYQDKLPNKDEIEKWFVNPKNGVGTLGGWNDTIWLDFDVKQFNSQEECDTAFFEILEKYPELEQSYLEQSTSGGYRIGVKVKNTPDFTNFSLAEGGKHIGEALGAGRFTVLAPSTGNSQKPYQNINRASLVPVDSLESIGIYPVKKKKETNKKTPALASRGTGNGISLELLATDATRAILSGDCGSQDKSEALTSAMNDLQGWRNWCNENDVPYNDNYLELGHIAGGALGIDEERVDRILNTIDENCRPSAEYMGNNQSCWKRVRKVSKDIFESKCPGDIKNEVNQEIKERTNKPSGKGFGSDDIIQSTPEEKNPNLVTTTAENTILEILFEDGNGNWTVMTDAYYNYTNKGYWRREEDAVIEKMIAQKLREIFVLKKKGDDYIKERKFATDRNKSSSFKFCRSALTEDTKSLYRDHLLAFNNCTVDVRTGEEVPHDKTHRLTSVISCDYVKGADCPKVFREFIINVFGEEMLPLIRAITAMFLDPTAPYGYFPHVIGSSGSGKGTLIRFWGSMFGEENIRSLNSFADISDPEGRHQYLTGTKFISFPDLGGWQRDLRAFYELIDNGSLSGRALFSSNGYEKRWFCRFAIASVDYLSIENAGDGWDRRCIPLPTKIRTTAVDTDLEKKLKQVRGDVISWALNMPKDERNRFIMNASQANEKIKNIKREQSVFSDSVRAFVDLVLRPSDSIESKALKGDVHDWYMSFCKYHGFSPLSIHKFSSHLKKVLPNNHIERKQYRKDGDRKEIPAHWAYLKPLPGSVTQEECLGKKEWQCNKKMCEEGGIEAFEEFWSGDANALTEAHGNSDEKQTNLFIEPDQTEQNLSNIQEPCLPTLEEQHKIKMAETQTKQELQEWMNEESLIDIANMLQECDTPEKMEDIRNLVPKEAIEAATAMIQKTPVSSPVITTVAEKPSIEATLAKYAACEYSRQQYSIGQYVEFPYNDKMEIAKVLDLSIEENFYCEAEFVHGSLQGKKTTLYDRETIFFSGMNQFFT